MSRNGSYSEYIRSRRRKGCPRCGKMRRIGQFFKDRSRPDGRDGYCKLCRRVMRTEFKGAHAL